MIEFNNDWDELLKNEFQKNYYLKLRDFLKFEYKNYQIYPNMHNIFNALKLTAFKDVKIVILGQDPYHGPNQAHGLAFSVSDGIKIPPSLKNIFKELENDLLFTIPQHGNLTNWAKNGVLLLNTTLTVRAELPNSHSKCGWNIFTDYIISLLNSRNTPIVFMLWGANARKKKELITNASHLILEAPHPSPLSAYSGFFDCKHFSKANSFILENYNITMDWSL